MSIYSSILANGTGQFLVNPAETSTSNIAAYVDHPALGQDQDIMDSINSYVASINSHMSNQLSSMSINLPMMSAVESIQKSVNTCDGEFPGANGGSLFNQAMSGLTGAVSLTDNLHAQIQEILMNAEVVRIDPMLPPTPDNCVPNTQAIADIQELLTDATTSLENIGDTSSAAIAAGQAQLQNFAFGSFLSAQHSPAVQEVLQRFTAIPPGLAKERDMIGANSTALQGTVIPQVRSLPTPDTIASPPVSTYPRPMDSSMKASLQAEVDRTKAVLDAAKVSYTASLQTCQNWQASNNYKEAKDAWMLSGDETSTTNYQNLKARYESEVYNNHLLEHSKYALARDDYQQALTNYSNSIGQ